jgi:PAS domain S-box-containing protein
MSAYDKKGKYVLTVYAFIFLFMAMGIIAGGILSYSDFELGFRRQAEKQISAIAELKVNGLVNWRSERLSDARFFYRNPVFSSLVEGYFENPDDASLRAEVTIGMEHYQSNAQYDQISLLDAEGKSWLAVPDSLEEPNPNYFNLKRDIAASLDSGEVMFLDFQRDPAMGDRIYIPILVPIFSEKDQHPLGVLAIRIDPETYLYPYINQWPIPSDTAETLLVRRDGDDVLFLNELRFAQDSALNLRYSLTETNIPAVKAVLGQTGLVEGTDYRGQFVLADVRQIPDSPWFLVSKANAEEVYAPLRERLWQTLLIVGMAIFISGLALFAIWRQQRILFYRSKAETAEKLREAQLVLESSPVILFRWKAAEGWPVELVSENVAQFGYKVEDLLSGMVPYASIIHPDDLERVHREVKEYSDSGVDRFQQEYRILTKDGQVRWTDDRTVIERDAEGNITHFQGTVTDVTERKRAVEELDRQTALFRNLFERSPEALTIVDQKDRILNVNRSFETLFGYREAEIQGQYVNDLIVSESYLDEAESITQISIGVGQVVEKETVRCTKDGRLVDVSMVGYPIVVAGRIIGGAAIYRDITERKRAEEELRRQTAMFRNLFAGSPEAIAVLDHEDCVLEVNQSFENLFGYLGGEICGRNINDLVTSGPYLDDARDVSQTVLGKRQIVEKESIRCAKDGRPVDVSIIGYPIILGQHMFGAYAIYRDITERKKMERSLHERERQYRTLVEQIPAIVYVDDVSNGIHTVYIGPQIEKFLGYTPQEWMETAPDIWETLTSADDRQTIHSKYMRCAQDGEPFEAEYRMRTADGRPVWVHDQAVLLRDENGSPQLIHGVMQDITERKQAEEALRAAEEKYRHIFENAMEAITQTTPDGKYVVANPSAARMLGFDSPQEMISSVSDLDQNFYVEPGRREEFKRLMEEYGVVTGFESEAYRKDGSRIWILENSHAVRDEHGNLLYYEGTAQDITERKRAEERLEQFFSINLDLLCIADVEGNFIKVNKAWEDILGYSAPELEHRKFLEFVHPDDMDATLEAVARLGNQERVLNFVNRYRCMDGSYRFIEWRSQPSGSLVYAAARDITERKQAEEALRASEEKMSSIFRVAPTGIGVVRNRVLVEVNPRISEMTGYTKEELLGQSARILYPTQEEFEWVGSEKYRQIAEKGTGTVETRWQTKDGSLIDVLLASTPIDLADLSRGVTFTALDITERKRTEEALMENEAIFSSFLEHSPVYVFFKDKDIRSLRLSKNYEQMLGMPIGDLLGKTMDDLFPSDLAKSMVADDLRILNEGRRITVVEELNGHIYETTKFPVLKDGEPYILAGFTLDITERKQAAEALEKSEALYHDLVETSQDLIWQCNAEGEYTYLNPAWEQVFGYKIEEMLGKKFTDFQSAETATHDQEEFFHLLQGNTVRGWETVHIGKSGKEIQLAFNAKCLMDENGKIIGTRGTAYDITARKQAEKALLESEERFRTYYDNATIGLYRTSPDGYILMLNPAGIRMMGFDSFDEISRRNLEDAEFKAFRTEFREKIERDGIVIGLESKWIKKDGSTIFVRESAKAMRDGNGKTLYYDGSFEDVTERVRAESALRESEELYRRMNQNSPLGMHFYVLDESNQLIFAGANPAADKLLGVDNSQFIGKSIEEAFPPLIETEAPQRYRDAAAKGVPWSIEQIAYADGQISGAFEVRAFQTTPQNMVAVFADISARKRAEEEIHSLNAELEQRVRERTLQLETTNKELEAFSYSVSHDLRAPLRGIDGWSQALLEDYQDKLDAQGRQYIDRVRSETQRMGHLIDDMLKLSRLTRAEINKEEVDLSALAHAIVERLKRGEPHRRVEVNIQSGMIADCDSNLLEVVLSNLLENAFKFTSKREDARIEFGRTELEGRHVFFVHDNGAGFDMTYAQKLFGAFQRMHKASEFPGTGIGLATVQRIIHRHGGRVWAEAEPGQGAVFYFTLD